MHAASPILQLSQVDKSFDGQGVLENVDFSAKKGEFWALMGPSGAGKSVILKILAGILRPDGGEVCLFGENILQISASSQQALYDRVGMLFQRNALFDSLSVRENVAFPLRERKSLAEAEIRDRANHFLELVGLGAAADLAVNEISGGMQKRLGIARALVLEPEVILYDDPTAGLDPITSRKIMKLIRQLQVERGATVVMVSHDVTRVFEVASHIAFAFKMSFLPTGSVQETISSPDPRVQQFIHGRTEGPLEVST